MTSDFKLTYVDTKFDNYKNTFGNLIVRCTLKVKDSLTGRIRTFNGYGVPKNGDTYDETIGRKVALAKAENQAYKFHKQLYKQSMGGFADMALVCEDAIKKCERVIKHNVEYIKKF